MKPSSPGDLFLDSLFYFIHFVDVVDDVDGFSNIVPSLHSWDESHLIMMDDLFDTFLSSVF